MVNHFSIAGKFVNCPGNRIGRAGSKAWERKVERVAFGREGMGVVALRDVDVNVLYWSLRVREMLGRRSITSV